MPTKRQKKGNGWLTGWLLLGVAVLGVVLFLVLRGGQQQQSPTGAEGSITVRAGNFFFSPRELTAQVGEEVVLDMRVTGVHTFTIDELGVNVRLRQGTDSVRFTPDRPGQFEYYCAVPGHRERGMLGALTVEEGSA